MNRSPLPSVPAIIFPVRSQVMDVAMRKKYSLTVAVAFVKQQPLVIMLCRSGRLVAISCASDTVELNADIGTTTSTIEYATTSGKHAAHLTAVSRSHRLPPRRATINCTTHVKLHTGTKRSKGAAQNLVAVVSGKWIGSAIFCQKTSQMRNCPLNVPLQRAIYSVHGMAKTAGRRSRKFMASKQIGVK